MKTSSIVTVIAAMSMCAASQAQAPVFGHRTYPGIAAYNHADLNNDGREDLIFHTQTGFAVALSTADATYAAPVSYNVPNNQGSGTVSLDINNDGKLDVIAFNTFAPGFYEYVNTGNGALHLQATFPMANMSDMVVGDFNHDGFADIAFTTAPGSLHVWFNNHSGGFTAGPTTSAPALGQLTVGDFDGDGAADLATTTTQSTYLYFGDNTGHFKAVNATTAHHPQAYLMDIDGDGKSDLVGAAVAGSPEPGVETFFRDVWVVYGNSSRNIIENDIPLNGYARPWTWGVSPDKSPSVDVGDFNGDGKRDFAIVESQNADGSGTATLAVKLGQLSRTWGSEVNVYSNTELGFGVAAIRATQNLKPDLLVDVNSQSNQFFVNDTTGGYFGGCKYPNTAIGIQVCSPTTYSSTSALFAASVAGQTAMRKVEIWVDGVKKYQELAKHDYSHYGLMDVTMTLSVGTHQVTIIGAGYDNLTVKKSYTVTVQ
jgi:hypothetical protein